MEPIQHLVLRSELSRRLTPAEMDEHWEIIEAYVNAMAITIGVSFNEDGTLKSPPTVYAASASGSDAYSITVAGDFDTIADLAGVIILVKIDVANVGDATLAVNGFAATAIKKFGTISLGTGDIKVGVAAFIYDTANSVFNLISPATNPKTNYSTTTNSGNDYTITIANANSTQFEVPNAAAYVAGYELVFKASATCAAGAARLKLVVTSPALDCGFASLKKLGNQDMDAGDIVQDQIYRAVYDGTNFQLLNPSTAERGTRYMLVQDQKATTTGGGTFTSGAWRTRDLNTTVYNGINGASLAASQITLPAGTYRATALGIGHDCGNHQIRLRNVTAGATLAVGTNARSTLSSNVGSPSEITGCRFTLSTSSVIELQHQCSNTGTFGVANSFGEVEVYSSVEIQREA